ncbi:hypothetical protein CPLU01_08154 [Colletotrichum plurivorum]|uniref:DUF6536 domain-containing protein n=1 Tax=Colletotrichum plurivorum TaxID=2175906 RepID=A0A8H6KDD8_9PEZI|nr:hypothetical protein CPLU01_08154 [Colletotrichum plurivorum]
MRQLFGQPLTGWRLPAILLAASIWLLTIVLWILLAVAVARTSSSRLHDQGLSAIFDGDCGSAKTLLAALRLAISVSSSLVLLSSNYFMQLVVAPSREDVDAAHSQSRWVDIGVPSTRNLRFVSNRRPVMWLFLALSSLPFHLLFNASVFGVNVSQQWVTVLAAESFLSGEGYYLPGIGLGPPPEGEPSLYKNAFNISIPRNVEYMASNAYSWDRLSGRECLQKYADPTNVHDRRHLLAVISTGDNNGTGWNVAQKLQAWQEESHSSNATSSSIWYAGFCGLNSAFSGMADGVNLKMKSQNGNDTSVWVHSNRGYPQTFDQRLGYQWINDLVDNENNWIIDWQARGHPSGEMLLNETLTVEYCLSEPVSRVCRIRVNKIIFLTVCFIALGKSYLCITVLHHVWRTQPLATIGDAVDSFMRQPDPTTRGMCTFGQSDFSRKTGWNTRRKRARGWIAGSRRWETRRRRWGDAVRVSDWLTAYSIGIFGFVLGALTLGSFIGGVGGWQAAMSRGTFGQDPDNPVFYMKYPSKLLEEIVTKNATDSVGAFLLVNIPQLGMSITILALNVIYTRMFMAREWASYSQRCKPLRVSIPRGRQKSNHVLQIPLPYAIGIQVIGVLAHWLCANAVYATFMECKSVIEIPGLTDWSIGSYLKITNILLSFKAAVGTMIVFFVMLLVPIVAACFRLPSESVLVGSCSAAISAACHALQPSSQAKGTPLTPREEPVADWNLPGSKSYQLGRLGYETLPDVDAADDNEAADWRTQMAEEELKWGVVTGKGLPATHYDESADDLLMVEHLAFGSTGNAVQRVREGAFYAGVAGCED